MNNMWQTQWNETQKRQDALSDAFRLEDLARKDFIVAHESGKFSTEVVKLFDDELEARSAYFERCKFANSIGSHIHPYFKSRRNSLLNTIKNSEKWILVQKEAQEAEALLVVRAREETDMWLRHCDERRKEQNAV
jgi:hypothetical protein